MLAPTLTRRLLWTAEFLLLAGTVAAAVTLTHAGEWQPLALVVLLLVLALAGQWLSVEISGGQLSASMVAVVLAMSLLGPAPAMACGIAAMVLTSAIRRLAPAQWLNNLSTFAVIPFVGGLSVRALTHIVRSDGGQATRGITFGLIVFGVFAVILALSFLLFALDVHIEEGRPMPRVLRELMALLPGELAAGVLATVLAVGYTDVGLPTLVAGIAVLLIFRQLTVALLRSEDRAEQLAARSHQLASLQWGVLRTLGRALNARDQSTGQHAAAVASYAQALAREIGCSEEQSDVVHTAGLLHEIGKFTWPDSVLHGDLAASADLEIVKNHPQEGAVLVGALDGYGEVADAILYHHERVDGSGYPAGLIGQEIPLASRILAICSAYDTLTADRGYRSAVAPREAMAELRLSAERGQFDRELVERFIAVLEREGMTFAKDANYDTELDFGRRVRQMAEPESSRDGHGGRSRSPLRQLGSEISSLRQRALHKV